MAPVPGPAVPVYNGFSPIHSVGASATKEQKKRLLATIEADRQAMKDAVGTTQEVIG